MSQAIGETTVRHQRVGSLELFCDLVFVVAIERLTHLLHGDPGRGCIAATIGLTMLVWFAWFNVTALTNVRGGIGPRGRPLMFASMAGVGVLALGVEPLIDGHPWLFAVGYVIARTAVWPLWGSGRRGAGAMRPLLWVPGVSALWLLTPLVPEHLLGWALAALAFLEMSLLLLRPDGKESDAPRLSGPHLVERIGLFVMIVLGESVVQIVDSLDTERTAMTWLTAACSAHLHPGSLTCLCLGMILVHVGTQSLTRQAFATNLGLKPRRRPQTAAERAQVRREPAAAREERARDATGAPHDPQGTWHAILGGLTQLATYLVPVVVIWWLGGHWAPWIVITLLFLYISAAIWVQGYGERRITAYVETMRAGEVAGGTGTVGGDVAGAAGASTADDATNGRAE